MLTAVAIIVVLAWAATLAAREVNRRLVDGKWVQLRFDGPPRESREPREPRGDRPDRGDRPERAERAPREEMDA